MTVQWQLSSTQECSISWGTDIDYTLGSATTTEKTGGPDQHIHSYTITGLASGSLYFYRVLIDGRYHTGSFVTAPDSSTSNLSFIVYGDMRTQVSIHNEVAGNILAVHDFNNVYRTFTLAVGDLVTNGSYEYYWDYEFFNQDMINIQQLIARTPLITAVGNHDLGNGLFRQYFPYPYYSANGLYWSFDYGPVHVAVVDQYVPYSTGSAQYNWLQSDLAASTKTWKFIAFHQPGWSAAGGHDNNTDTQTYIEPLCETYDVSIVFAGHNHYYARAEVSYGSGKKVYHITTGGGGAPLHTPLGGQPNVITAISAYHFCEIAITGNTLNFSAVQLDGAVIDSFTITK